VAPHRGGFAWFSQPPRGLLGWPAGVAGRLACAPGRRLSWQGTSETGHGGPYAYTRNPLYLGTLLVAAASRCCPQPGFGRFVAAVFVLVYLPVIQNEEQTCRSVAIMPPIRPAVPLLLPRLTPGGKKTRILSGSPLLKNRK